MANQTDAFLSMINGLEAGADRLDKVADKVENSTNKLNKVLNDETEIKKTLNKSVETPRKIDNSKIEDIKSSISTLKDTINIYEKLFKNVDDKDAISDLSKSLTDIKKGAVGLETYLDKAISNNFIDKVDRAVGGIDRLKGKMNELNIQMVSDGNLNNILTNSMESFIKNFDTSDKYDLTGAKIENNSLKSELNRLIYRNINTTNSDSDSRDERAKRFVTIPRKITNKKGEKVDNPEFDRAINENLMVVNTNHDKMMYYEKSVLKDLKEITVMYTAFDSLFKDRPDIKNQFWKMYKEIVSIEAQQKHISELGNALGLTDQEKALGINVTDTQIKNAKKELNAYKKDFEQQYNMFGNSYDDDEFGFGGSSTLEEELEQDDEYKRLRTIVDVLEKYKGKRIPGYIELNDRLQALANEWNITDTGSELNAFLHEMVASKNRGEDISGYNITDYLKEKYNNNIVDNSDIDEQFKKYEDQEIDKKKKVDLAYLNEKGINISDNEAVSRALRERDEEIRQIEENRKKEEEDKAKQEEINKKIREEKERKKQDKLLSTPDSELTQAQRLRKNALQRERDEELAKQREEQAVRDKETQTKLNYSKILKNEESLKVNNHNASGLEDLKNKFKDLTDNNKVLDKEKISEVLNSNAVTDEINKQLKAIDRVNERLSYINKYNIYKEPEKKIDDSSSIAEVSKLETYKKEVSDLYNKLGELSEQKDRVFSNVKNASLMADINNTGLDKLYSDIDKIGKVLGNGLRVNLQGTEAENQLKQIEETFNKIKEQALDVKMDIPLENIQNQVQVNELEKVTERTRRYNESVEKAKANLNENIDKWKELQSTIHTKKMYEQMITPDYRENILKSAGKDEELRSSYNRAFSSLNTVVLSDKLKELEEQIKLGGGVLPQNYTPDFNKELAFKGMDEGMMLMLTKPFDEAKLRAEILDEKIAHSFSSISRRALTLGFDINEVTDKFNDIGEKAKSAFKTNDILAFTNALNEQSNILSKLKVDVDRYEDAYKFEKLQEQQKLNEVKTHVQNAYLTTGLQMPYEQQVEYYTEALSRFEEGSESYLVVLSLLRRAQQDLTNETERSTKQQAQAHEEAVNKIKSGINTVLNGVNSACNFIQSAVNRITNIIRTYLNIVKSIVENAVKVITLFKDSISRLLTLFGNFGNRVGIINNNSNILIGTFTTLRNKINSITSAFNQLLNNQMFKKAQYLYQSVFSLKNIVGDELTQSTIDWANNLEYAFGISAKGLLSDLNELSGVLYGLGMNKDDVAEGSQNILMLARYLAFMGAAGGDVQQVTNKLVSGMKGMTASIDDLGLSVREDQMNAFLKDLQAGNTILNKKLEEDGVDLSNMSTSFSGLNEQARVYIRYASLITQFDTKYNMVEFAGALETVTGRISIFKEAINSLATTVGQVLVVAFSHVAKYLYFIVITIEKYISKLFSLIGTMTELSTYMNDTEESKAIIDNLKEETEAIDELSRTAKRASKSMQGFDSVNSISTGSAGDFDYSQLMTSALGGLDELTQKYLDENKNYYKQSKDLFYDLVDSWKQKINNFFKEVTGKELKLNFEDINLGYRVESLITKIFGTPEDKEKGIAGVKGVLQKTLELIAQFGLNIANDLRIDKILDYVLGLVENLVNLLEIIVDRIGPKLQMIYDRYISPIVQDIGNLINNGLGKLNFKVQAFSRKLFYMDDNELDNSFGRIIVKIFNGFKPLKDILDAIKDIIINLIPIIKELGSGLITWIKTDGLNLIVDTLRWISDFLYVNKDAIVEIISRLGNFVADNFVIFLNEAKELLMWIADKKDAIISIIDIVQKFINFIAEHSNVFVDLGIASLLTNLLSVGTKLISLILGIVGGVNLLKGAFSGLGTILGGAGVTAGATAGAGAGATTAGATAGTGLIGTIGTLASTIAGLGALVLSVVGVIAKGLSEIGRLIDYGLADWNQSIANWGAETEIELQSVRESASDVVEGYMADFGKKIPTEAITNYVAEYKKSLEDAGIYTEEQIEANTKAFEKYIEKYNESNMSMVLQTDATLRSVGDKLKGWLGDLYTYLADRFDNIKELGFYNEKFNINMTNTQLTNGAYLGLKISEAFDNYVLDPLYDKVKTKSINGFAKGGLPRSGSIFVANENGNTELVGNFGGYSGVANNGMILTAMKDAIFEATANAILETNGTGTSTVVNNHFCENGILVGNKSALSQFANMISKAQSGNRNITGDIGFSI